MKAVRLHAKGDLRVEEVTPPPAPPEGWVKLRVSHAGICGSDLHNWKTGQWITRAPSIAGHEFTGTIVERGRGANAFGVGDRVAADSRFWCGECAACRGGARQLSERLGFVGEACDGGFAEEVILPERLLHKVPAALDPQIAATAEPVAVALHAVNRLRLRKGEPVLVVGCGPIGGFAAVVLKHFGFGPVLVVDRNAARAALVARVTGAEVASLDAGQRVSAAIDATGSVAALHQTIGCLAGGGTLALGGISHGKLDLDPNSLVERELSLIGCHAFADELPDAIALLPACQEMIAPLLDREITLDEVPEAYARLAAGETKGLKTLIRISSPPASSAGADLTSSKSRP